MGGKTPFKNLDIVQKLALNDMRINNEYFCLCAVRTLLLLCYKFYTSTNKIVLPEIDFEFK